MFKVAVCLCTYNVDSSFADLRDLIFAAGLVGSRRHGLSRLLFVGHEHKDIAVRHAAVEAETTSF